MKIINYPNSSLRLKSRPIKKSELPEVSKFLPEFIQTMIEKDGVGLACPQIGKNINLFVAKIDDKVYTFINPRIIYKSWSKNIMEEGCLSIPDVYGLVKRPAKVWVIYQDETGSRKFLKADQLLARIIQHEYDHLIGRLFIDLSYQITQGQDNLDKLLKNHD